MAARLSCRVVNGLTGPVYALRSAIMERFRDSRAIVDDGTALAERMASDGYLFLPGLLPTADILALRRRMVDVLAEAGWIRRDGGDDMAAIADPAAFRVDTDPEATALIMRQAALPEVQVLQHHPVLTGLFERLFGEAVLPLPKIIARNLFPQQDEHTTPAHQDYPHVQGSQRTCAVWIPVGDCDIAMGGLQVAAGSHKEGVLPIEPAMGAGGLGVADVYEGRWRYSPFAAGDVVIFNSLTVHKGVPNRSVELRLSVDMRYQPAREPVCEEWLHPHRRSVDWPTYYKDWADDTYQYYWAKMKLNVVPFDPSYYENREAQALELAGRGDRRASATLHRILHTDSDPETRRRAQAALDALEDAR